MGWNETRNQITRTEIWSSKTTEEQTIYETGTTNQLCLTEKSQLTEAEEQILNTVGTTLQNKFQQHATWLMLHGYNLRQHQNNKRLPIFAYKTDHSTQQRQLQTVKIHDTLLTEYIKIRTDIRNIFQSFCSANGNKVDIFSNKPSLDKEEQEKCDASLILTELTTALDKSNSDRSSGLDGVTNELYKKFWNEFCYG
jgi:hypothetical protein